MFKRWLRKMIGWEDIGASLQAQRDYLVALESLVNAQGQEIEALKHQRELRALKGQSPAVTDWETVQAAYAANPENYKES